MITPVPIPARPVNGGRLELARPKIGQHGWEPKFDGWRNEVEVQTLDCYNRKREPLSISHKFAEALGIIKRTGFDFAQYVDTEGLANRHAFAKGTLVVLDYIAPMMLRVRESYDARRARLLATKLPVAPLDPEKWRENAVYVTPSFSDGMELYRKLREINKAFGFDFYEGVVAKLRSSTYKTMASESGEYPMWMKHRYK
jgi:ATP-dependent DNA ligase